jgi:hypothetical protein
VRQDSQNGCEAIPTTARRSPTPSRDRVPATTRSPPGAAFWATDPAGFGQVGCIYTAQGFEYEYSGVIIGPDLVARGGRLVTRREYSKDPAFRSRKQVSDAEADRLIRNTYKVLLTRGMRGTVLFATDEETREHLEGLGRPAVGAPDHMDGYGDEGEGGNEPPLKGSPTS